MMSAGHAWAFVSSAAVVVVGIRFMCGEFYLHAQCISFCCNFPCNHSKQRVSQRYTLLTIENAIYLNMYALYVDACYSYMYACLFVGFFYVRIFKQMHACSRTHIHLPCVVLLNDNK